MSMFNSLQANTESINKTKVSFHAALASLKINSVNDLKKLEPFSNSIVVHHEIINTVLRLLRGGKEIDSEDDWRDLGFSDANDVVEFFRQSNGMHFLLHLLFVLGSPSFEKIDIQGRREILEHYFKISKTIHSFLLKGKINTIPEYFTYYLVVVEYYNFDEFNENELENLSDLLNKSVYKKISSAKS